MKKILTALLAAALVVSPAAAQSHRDNGYDYDHSQRQDHREVRRDRDGNLILGIIIGGIAGAVITSSNDRDRYDDRYDRNYRKYHRGDKRHYRNARKYCTVEQVVEYRYGRKYVYNVENCNY
jgi:hypothetical protein